jgi:phage-related protein
MERNREIIFYENHFNDFYNLLAEDVKEKVDEVLYLIVVIQQIPKKFFDSITGVKGLFEIRVEFKSNIYRIFCCFDKGNLVILFNGFQKKTQKTPKKEIGKAELLMKKYFEEIKNIENGNTK